MASAVCRTGFGLILFLALACLGPPPAAAQDQPLNTVTINVTGDVNAGPVAKVWVTVASLSTGKVRTVEYPQNRTARQIATDGVPTDATGRIVLIAEPGEYRVTLTHPNFVKSAFRLVLYPDAPPEERDVVCDWTIRMRPELGARWIVVEVYRQPPGEKPRRFGDLKFESPTGEGLKGIDLAVPVRLLEWIGVTKADVGVYDEAGWYLDGGLTRAGGYVNLRCPEFVIGDIVTIKAKAEGFRPASRQLMVGAAQYTLTPEELGGMKDAVGPVAGGPAGTTKWDVARILLVEENAAAEAAVTLVVEADDQKSGQPLAGASVEVTSAGKSLGVRTTGADGKAGGVAVPPGPDGKAPDRVRVVVKREGYEEAWSDVPAELLEPSAEPRLYLVSLKKAETPGLDTSGYTGTWDTEELAIGPMILTASGTKLTGTFNSASTGKMEGTWDPVAKAFRGTWTETKTISRGSFKLSMSPNGWIGGLWSPGYIPTDSGTIFILKRKR